MSISASVAQEGNFEIQGADLFLVSDLALAFAAKQATNPRKIEASLTSTIRVIDNQGLIRDSTGTVELGRGP